MMAIEGDAEAIDNGGRWRGFRSTARFASSFEGKAFSDWNALLQASTL
jgi:hypothetical protein